MGIGEAQSFSKIKMPSWRLAKPKTKIQLKTSTFATIGRVSASVRQRSRLATHVLLILIATALVFTSGASSSNNTQVASLLSGESGFGSVLDPLAAADVAATVAQQTDLLVAGEANQTATTLSSQVNLPLAGEDYLAKRQVVATAGNANRGLTNYRVKTGETVATIAANFNVTTDTIKWANNLQSDQVTPGQKLVILPITGVLHKVVAGETPELLARRYQANAAQIVSFNNAEVKGLEPGKQIVIPDGVVPQAQAPVTRLARSSSSVAATTTARSRYSFRANGYAFGYCTYYVAGRRPIPNNWGDARNWYYNAQYSGFRVGRTPAVGAIAWTPRGYYGHVAYVEQVNGSQVLVSEMNYNGNWNRVTSRWVNYTEFGGYIY